MTRVNPDWYVEHYASWYTATKTYGPTPGQGPLHPQNMQEAAGVLYKTSDPAFGIQGCFECHSTGPVSFADSGEARLTEAGVHCEACHGPGAAHVKDPGHHSLRNPARLTAAELNSFCGRCHRPPAAEGARAPEPVVKVNPGEFTPALQNDAGLTRKTVALFREVLGADHIHERPVTMGGEDFGRYGREGVPIFMYFLGTVPPERVAASLSVAVRSSVGLASRVIRAASALTPFRGSTAAAPGM